MVTRFMLLIPYIMTPSIGSMVEKPPMKTIQKSNIDGNMYMNL